jgi:type IV secretion system protein VirD4
LLLPQEVKELGPEEAIVFYEGLRPIRCRKIRYYADKRFRKRLRPPPVVPVPPALAPVALSLTKPPSREAKGEAAPSPGRGLAAPKKEAVVIREATVDDVERLESLTLEDFASDFSKVQVPDKEGPLTDGEMKVAVDSFLTSLERT